jgi:hypothetical protein
MLCEDILSLLLVGLCGPIGNVSTLDNPILDIAKELRWADVSVLGGVSFLVVCLYLEHCVCFSIY